MALTQISNVVTFLDKCIRNVNDLVQNSSMVAVNECLIELNNYDIPATHLPEPAHRLTSTSSPTS